VQLSTHLEGLREAMVAFVRSADRAGWRAPVPTCPGWTVRRLVAHQGMVHRWATAELRGAAFDPSTAERHGFDAGDPLDWLREGAIGLVAAVVSAPEDLDATVFLADAPPARRFWARRQCHETTIHAVDALAAALGRLPTAADASWVREDVATDGIDELLTGFLPRESTRLHSDGPLRLGVLPDGAACGWVVDVGPEVPATARVAAADVDGDVVLRGSAVGLQLTLWNRSDECPPDGAHPLWSDWRELVRVSFR
jgi:uncharacterized protein (TIGR03083 family)